MGQAIQYFRDNNAGGAVNIPVSLKKMGGNQPVAAEEINQCQGLHDGRGHQRHHDNISEKSFVGDGGSRQGIGKKENYNSNNNSSNTRYIKAMPQGSECVCSGKVLLEII